MDSQNNAAASVQSVVMRLGFDVGQLIYALASLSEADASEVVRSMLFGDEWGHVVIVDKTATAINCMIAVDCKESLSTAKIFRDEVLRKDSSSYVIITSEIEYA